MLMKLLDGAIQEVHDGVYHGPDDLRARVGPIPKVRREDVGHGAQDVWRTFRSPPDRLGLQGRPLAHKAVQNALTASHPIVVDKGALDGSVMFAQACFSDRWRYIGHCQLLRFDSRARPGGNPVEPFSFGLEQIEARLSDHP